MRKVKASGKATTDLRFIWVFNKNNIIGWRRNYSVKGRPDFVFRDRKIAVFVDGVIGMGTIVEIRTRSQTKNIGTINVIVISNMIKK